MKRTTIMAPEGLLERLQAIANQEQVSLAEIIREGLELRVNLQARQPRFVGSGRSKEPPYDIGRQTGDISYELRSWR